MSGFKHSGGLTRDIFANVYLFISDARFGMALAINKVYTSIHVLLSLPRTFSLPSQPRNRFAAISLLK